jgi:hypothetical protein
MGLGSPGQNDSKEMCKARIVHSRHFAHPQRGVLEFVVKFLTEGESWSLCNNMSTPDRVEFESFES